MLHKTPRVLITDLLSEMVIDVFSKYGIHVDFQPDLGRKKEKLYKIINSYDGLVIRSVTKVTEQLIDNADNLKVIGRAGIGVDNIDLKSASRQGIIVMNTPFGNSITTAEHTISMMMAVARQISAADRSTQDGKWEKSRFMGVEVNGKVLGLIGCGNIGSIVANRAIGMKMRVIVFDPFLGEERATQVGVEKVELDRLLERADFISLHTPLTSKTRNIINAVTLSKMKRGVRIINCARGGLIVEADLANALKNGMVAGAGIDVFEVEPAQDNVLFGIPNFVCTPHLGAATMEAQDNVALQVAEQMSAYLIRGSVTNALNMPSISAEEAPLLTPFVKLAETLGSFLGQVTDEEVKQVKILYDGHIADLNTRALNSAILAGLMRPIMVEVNMVSALIIASERGIRITEIRREKSGIFEGYIKLTVITETETYSVAGTVFSDSNPRFIQIKGINMEAEAGSHMLYATNRDVPGIIGKIGSIFGESGINIANFYLGRDKKGGNAIALIELDDKVPEGFLSILRNIPEIDSTRALEFDL
ncbi:phosphoglycerate dehydrogenase [Candidatus Endowatersipora endosymbiont of Watersipora subatra]|uniref:phosphoglycerate dehydrogenase n=1 Tax=Candidatus Endowatersipora endosymbiont of Watersipora subatra TaxID=3077946 RepID=UPI00312CAEB4